MVHTQAQASCPETDMCVDMQHLTKLQAEPQCAWLVQRIVILVLSATVYVGVCQCVHKPLTLSLSSLAPTVLAAGNWHLLLILPLKRV